MAERVERKLNRLERLLPEGLLVDAAWLTEHGYSTSLRSQYVAAGWLEQPTRRVYRRKRGSLSWQQVVISLQTLLDWDLDRFAGFFLFGFRCCLDVRSLPFQIILW